jgi:hypothetical protein
MTELKFDLSLVHADDELLDLLGGANLDGPDAVPDDQLSALLMEWRRDIEAKPIGDIVDPKLATVTVLTAKRKRMSSVLVIAAAILTVVVIVMAFAV